MAEKNILSEIAAYAEQRVRAAKKKKPLEKTGRKRWPPPAGIQSPRRKVFLLKKVSRKRACPSSANVKRPLLQKD